MQYNQPYGVADPNAPYINGNPSTGTQGSIPPAASIEYPQREIANLISDGGFTPSNSDLRQMGRSLQSGRIWSGIDTGVRNALQVNLSPPPLTYYDGMFVWVLPANTNDGPATVQLNGLPAAVIVRRGGGDLVGGDLPASYRSLLCYNALHANFELYGLNFSGGTTGFLPILTQNTNLYVNGSTGSDTLYDGTSATVVGPGSPKAGPFKTIGKAVASTWTFGPSVYTMTINISAGTYPENILTPAVVGPRTIFKGAGATLTFLVGQAGGHSIQATSSNQITVQGIHVNAPQSFPGASCFVSTNGATLTTISTATGSAPNGYLFDTYNGYMNVGSNSFDAGSTCLNAFTSFTSGAMGLSSGAVYTFAGAMTVSGALAVASGVSTLSVPTPAQGGVTPVFVNPGNVSGTRYIASLIGLINTQGLGINYFPGTVAGSIATGGQYN
jgi:hypothetical protein